MNNILAHLLHHANRCSKDHEFYQIKDRLLQKYGEPAWFDIQHIEGKHCSSCEGTGIHYKYDYRGKVYERDACWHCYNGWFKRPMWVMLERRKFGRYTFHKPIDRKYCEENPYRIPSMNFKVIDGYISHQPAKYSYLALWLLYLVYNPRQLKKELQKIHEESRYGWRVCWWLPRNWYRCASHIIQRRGEAYPVRQISPSRS
jgi:hypothetical protein